MPKKSRRELVVIKLEKDIYDGIYSPGDKLPSLRSLAELYGVSHATVNAALRQLVDVGLLEAHPYKGILVAGSNDKPPGIIKSTIAVLVDMGRQSIPPDLVNPIYDPIITTLSRTLETRGIHTLVSYICYRDENSENNLKQLVNKVDGLFVVGLVNLELRDALAKTGKPVISILPAIDTLAIDTVEIDEFQVFFDVTTGLLKKGIKAPVFFEGQLSFRNALLRYNGILYACQVFGYNFSLERVIEATQWNYQCFEDTFRTWLQRGFNFDAVICANDNFAISAIRILQEYGLKVPADVSVFGAKNTLAGMSTIPRLSTVDYHFEDLVETAVSKLFSRLAGSALRMNRTLFYGTILERESSR